MKFRPVFNNVVVTLEEASDTAGKEGILVAPEIAKERPNYGTVVAVGPDVNQVKVGDKVMFAKYSGRTFEVEGKDYQYMAEISIVGVLGD